MGGKDMVMRCNAVLGECIFPGVGVMCCHTAYNHVLCIEIVGDNAQPYMAAFGHRSSIALFEMRWVCANETAFRPRAQRSFAHGMHKFWAAFGAPLCASVCVLRRISAASREIFDQTQ